MNKIQQQIEQLYFEIENGLTHHFEKITLIRTANYFSLRFTPLLNQYKSKAIDLKNALQVVKKQIDEVLQHSPPCYELLCYHLQTLQKINTKLGIEKENLEKASASMQAYWR